MDDSEQIKELEDAFQRVETIYIADGHHRSASSVRVRDLRKTDNPEHSGGEEYNFFMGVLVPHNQVQILSYNRVVKDLNHMTEDQFLKQLEKNFEVTLSQNNKPYSPKESHSFGMYLGSSWYCLKTRPGVYEENDPVESLDVQILQKNVLSSLLGIEDPRRDKRIDFVGGIRGLEELEKRVNEGAFQVAFSLYATTIEDLMRIADANKVMPPKSTWFEPKLRSGLVIHLLS
jgi:uncharacterized protein (DUF1015 family)